MSPQKKTAGGGGTTGGQNRKGAKGVPGQKETSSVANAEQNNPQNSTASNKKHNIANVINNNNNTTDQLKTEKEKPHAKPTAEQIRIAQILEFKNGTQDPTREKVIQLMEMTERSEEDACLALYECDNDVEQAVIYLLENLEVGALVTNTKKKKNKSAQDGSGDGDEFESSNNREASKGDSDRKGARGSNRGGGMGANRGRSRGGGRDGRAGETGENRGEDRGKPRGRGGFSNRGGRGRGTGGRGGRERNFRPQEQPQEIDNWDPTSTQIDSTKNEDQTWGNCGDWDNEEYTGSLAETKVFTPSTQQDISAPPGLEQQIHQQPPTDYSSTVSGNATGQYGELHSASTAAQQLRQALEMPSLAQQSSVPLSAEQSQYFNTLGSQNSGAGAAYQSSVQYSYNDQQQAPRSQAQQAQQQRTRARVPPPSKIPASAVEMPDVDLPAYLDVQFGGLDFGTGTEESYETDKFTQGIDQSTGDDYTKGTGVVTSKSTATQGLGGLQPSQLIQNADSISSSTQADLSSGYAQRTTASMGTGTTQSALDQLKPGADIYASAATGTNAYQNLSYQSATQKGYQAGYGANAYNATQTSSNYPASTNTYGGYNQSSYQQQSQGTQSSGNVTGQQTQTSANGNVGAPNQSTTGYMSSQYPNQSGYQQNSYQSQNVYASNTNEFSGSINSLTSKLKGTQGTFDSSANTVSSGTSSVSSSTAITTSSINTSSLGGAKSSTTKTSSSQVSSASNVTASGATGTTAAGVGQSATNNGASNVVQNIPLVSSYMPAFYQQSYLPFEDMQLVQPRTMTYYYDQTTPTSVGVRSDGTTPNLAYPTMSADGRFARTDNNSSPVQSQQTGSSQQLMNIPPYAYFYGTNVVPGGFQQFPQIYSQMPATNPTASQFAKQSAYSGGYGSTGYDTLNQTTPEYNKTTYQSSGQPSKGHSASSQSGTNTDIASSMYNKSHVTLNKVNSYDKQSFHSGTPPPFNLSSQAGSQTQAYQQHLYLPAMAPHHNINMHQPIHQDTNNSGQRQQSGNQSKTGSKPAYSSTYWNTQN